MVGRDLQTTFRYTGYACVRGSNKKRPKFQDGVSKCNYYNESMKYLKAYSIDILQYGRGSNIKQDKQIRHVQPLVFCINFSPFGS